MRKISNDVNTLQLKAYQPLSKKMVRTATQRVAVAKNKMSHISICRLRQRENVFSYLAKLDGSKCAIDECGNLFIKRENLVSHQITHLLAPLNNILSTENSENKNADEAIMRIKLFLRSQEL